MFDEMPVDQFYQFLAARTTVPHHPTSANCLSFSLHQHHHHHQGPAVVDPSSYSHYSPPPPPPQQGFISPHLLNQPPLHLQLKNEDKEEAGLTSELDLVHHSNWSNDEVLALLRIRSSLDNNWFPDFIWENVSRKLGDLGFKRSAENCKHKFEEETRSFNTTINANSNNNNNCTTKNNNISTIQNYRLFGELEDLYNNHHPPPHLDHPQQCAAQSDHDQSPSRQLDDDNTEEEDKHGGVGENLVDVSDEKSTEENRKRVIRKRKRMNKFEMFKGYCESIVNKLMAQQEDLHCKILQDMANRDQEKIAREEAWKKEEFERIQMEMKVRAHELAIVGDRQAKIISLLNNFTSSSTTFSLEPQSLIEAIDNLLKVQKYYTSSSTTSSPDLTQDSIISAQPTSSSSTHDQNPSFLTPNVVETSKLGISQNPNENNILFKFPSIPIDKSLGSIDHNDCAKALLLA